MAKVFRIVKARFATRDDMVDTVDRVSAAGIPSPDAGNVAEALNNPAQWEKRVADQDVKLQSRREAPPTRVVPTTPPSAPNMADYIRKGK